MAGKLLVLSNKIISLKCLHLYSSSHIEKENLSEQERHKQKKTFSLLTKIFISRPEFSKNKLQINTENVCVMSTHSPHQNRITEISKTMKRYTYFISHSVVVPHSDGFMHYRVANQRNSSTQIRFN